MNYLTKYEFENEYQDYLNKLRENIKSVSSIHNVVNVKNENIELTKTHDYGKYWNLFTSIYDPQLEESGDTNSANWKTLSKLSLSKDKIDLESFIELDSKISAILNRGNIEDKIEILEEQFEAIVCDTKYDLILNQLNNPDILNILDVNYNGRYEDYLWKEVETAKYLFDENYEAYIESALNIAEKYGSILDSILEIYHSTNRSYINSNIERTYRYRGISEIGLEYEEEIKEVADRKILEYKRRNGKYAHEIIWDFYENNYENLDSPDLVFSGLKEYEIDLNVELDFEETDTFYLGGNLDIGDSLSHVRPIIMNGYKDEKNENGIYERDRIFESDRVKRLYIPHYVKDLINHNYQQFIRDAENLIREDKGKHRIRGLLKSETEVYNTLLEVLSPNDRIIREKSIYSDRLKRIDFYLPGYKVAIEYNGIQHYEPVDFFGGAEGLKRTQNSDALKKQYCEENGIRYEVIKYDQEIKDRLISVLDSIED